MQKVKSTNVTDMTVGSPMKHILAFAVPLLIGNLFQQLYNMVDSIVVGNYVGADALAAVGTCGAMNFLFFSLSAGLAIGIGVIVSQFFGAKNEVYVRKTIANSIYVLVSVSIIASILGVTLGPQILRLMDTPAHILGDASIYVRTTCIGIIAISAYNGIASILRALGDSKTPLYFLILASIINVILDLLFVLYFQLGVFGVGLATIIAQAIAAISCFIYAWKKVDYFRLDRSQMHPEMDIIKKSFKLGIPLALQNSMIAISCMALQGIVNSFGATAMATYTIIGRIEQVVQQPYASLGAALTTYSGQNMGAKKYDRIRIGFRHSSIITLIFSISLIPIAYLFGGQIIGIFVKEPAVIEMGIKALKINSLCYFGLGMIHVPRAILNGCGDAGFAMINGLTEVICRILYSQILIRIPFIGIWGIWITNAATWVTTAIVCIVRYTSGIWKNKKLTS